MPSRNSFELRPWIDVFTRADLALRKAKAYGCAHTFEPEEWKVARARIEFIESCSGPLNARIFAGYNHEDEWREFREQEPILSKIIDDIIGVFNFYWYLAKSDPDAFNHLSQMETAVIVLKMYLNEGAIQPKKTRVEALNEGDRWRIRIDQREIPVERCEAIYFELLLDASRRNSHVSLSMVKTHASDCFLTHPERILSKLKAKLPKGMIETDRKGSRIASEYLSAIDSDIEG